MSLGPGCHIAHPAPSSPDPSEVKMSTVPTSPRKADIDDLTNYFSFGRATTPARTEPSLKLGYRRRMLFSFL